MVEDIECIHTKQKTEFFVNWKAALDRRVQRPETWPMDEVSPERSLPDWEARSWIDRYWSKGCRIQPPVSRDGLPVDICGATMQIDGRAGNQVRIELCRLSIGQDIEA